ncbi:hypothetical protein LTR53_006048 [Teratosphaeriaceae sp. CCFEE 6253]|nr:hypothetical protein LTR53_006048 [Teratosphaeriaceae sp. CCFEE 6253]
MLPLNRWDQPECSGCRRLGRLFIEDARRRRLGEAVFTTSATAIHSSLTDLNDCASRSGCRACQIFRRAILLTTSTHKDCASPPAPTPEASRVSLRLRRNEQTRFLEARVDEGSGQARALVALSTESIPRAYPRLSSVEPLSPPRLRRLRGWIGDCHAEHSCGNYRFSSRKPTWLIHIASPEDLQLVPGGATSTPYVALSYCWGDERAVNASRQGAWEEVLRGYTSDLEKRTMPFKSHELPSTLQDAVTIVHSLGLEYVWIDSVCVPLGSWDTEANRMHELGDASVVDTIHPGKVYGNAHFTLSSSSTANATDRMLTSRDAWADDVQGVRLHEPWLLNTDMPLDEVRLTSPASARGWILQEERLSPRILYWCTQRAYWSCVERQHIENRQPGGFGPATVPALALPQGFLVLCRRGPESALRTAWCDVVSSYARRTLAQSRLVENRFAAFSGMAVRYLNARSSVGTNDDYLAGLWRSSIAEDLAWTVRGAGHATASLQRNTADVGTDSETGSIPTWSWLSVPLCTEIEMATRIDRSPHFKLNRPVNTRHQTDVEVVAKGAKVKALPVSGRLRPLIANTEAVLVPWEAIERQTAAGHSWYDFSFNTELSVFARSHDGRILVYEPHKAEVISQLDYLVNIDPSGNAIEVQHGQETRLHCLEIGASAMLILQIVDAQPQQHRRVGVSIGYRTSFFDGCLIQAIEIV